MIKNSLELLIIITLVTRSIQIINNLIIIIININADELHKVIVLFFRL